MKSLVASLVPDEYDEFLQKLHELNQDDLYVSIFEFRQAYRENRTIRQIHDKEVFQSNQ